MRKYPKIDGIFMRENHKPYHLIRGAFRNGVLDALHACNHPWQWTEKVDGTNIRVFWDGHHVQIAGRSSEDVENLPPFLWNFLSDIFLGSAAEQKFEEKFGEYPVILFGEGYGPRIQKGGGNYSDEIGFILFDVIGGPEERDEIWFQYENVQDVGKFFGLEVVQSYGSMTLRQAITSVTHGVPSSLALDHGKTYKAEGLVGVPYGDLRYRNGDRIILKLKMEDFNEV